MSKLKIKVGLCRIPEDYFEGSLETVVSMLAEYKKIYSNFSNLTVNADYYIGGVNSYNLSGERVESDEEYANRLKRIEKQKMDAEKQKKMAKKKELKEYLRLKKLFGED
jgi:hypothetical protein